MTNRGDPAGPLGWKRPSASQREYQRPSKCAGSKFLSRLLDGIGADGVDGAGAEAADGAGGLSSRGFSGMGQASRRDFI